MAGRGLIAVNVKLLAQRQHAPYRHIPFVLIWTLKVYQKHAGAGAGDVGEFGAGVGANFIFIVIFMIVTFYLMY